MFLTCSEYIPRVYIIQELTSTSSAKKKCTWDSIRAFDVVLTTYGTLGAEFKRLEKYELKKMNENEEPDQTEMNKLFPLFSLRSHFYRVILDEAQVWSHPFDVRYDKTKLISRTLVHQEQRYSCCQSMLST